jgi:hypothetical protein
MSESEPLIRVMALHALMLRGRPFYLEEKEIRIADAEYLRCRKALSTLTSSAPAWKTPRGEWI